MAVKKKTQCFKNPMFIRTVIMILAGFFVLTMAWGNQTKPPASFTDYGKWESLRSVGDRGGLSPDGRWIAYAINRSNGENELRITKIEDGKTETAAFGSNPAFSSDSKWIVYSIGYSEVERDKMRKDNKPVHSRLGLMNLAAGETFIIEGVESFSFSSDGAFLAMLRYGPRRSPERSSPASSSGRGGNSTAGESEYSPGKTLIIRNLRDGRDLSFGNVAQFAWQDTENSHLLAMNIATESKSGNGVHLFDPEKSLLRVLDSFPSVYSGLVWRKDAADLAVFRAKTDESKDGPTQMVLCWTGLDKTERKNIYDPTTDSEFPKGMRTVSFRPLTWTDDGGVLLLGIAKWDDKILPAEKEEKSGDVPAKDEPSSIEIWHWTDNYVMPWQKMHAKEDSQRNMPAALHLKSGKLIRLGLDPVNEQVRLIPHTRLAYVEEWEMYAMERSIGRPAADLYLLDINTGERAKLMEGINDRYIQAGPSGKYLLFLHDGHYWTVDLATRAITNITKSAPKSFINMESDSTAKIYPDNIQKPPFGVAGWTESDAAVLLYDKYDLWRIASDGSKAERLTNGAGEQVRHRLIRLDQNEFMWWRMGPYAVRPVDKWIDFSQPVYLSLFGEWTKKSGYARLLPNGEVAGLVWMDKNVGSLAKAENAEVYKFIVQDYQDSPDIFIGGPTLEDAKQVTETNPFQNDYAWGHSELIDYTTDKGRKLQGALFYPAGYQPGKKYPMIVYNYELLSQNVHHYVVPSDRSYYNISVFTSHGYLVLEPDIVFRTKQPGWSVVECITAGVRKVIEMGIVDPGRIGIIGHSMGGFNTTFVATHTDGIFAAAVAGAPITDLVSYYGDHHWGTGIAETDHIETGQERMEVALYEDLKAYIDNSAVFNAHNMTVPLLLEAGDKDGIIAWYQSIELYNIARRAKRNVVMLGYIGEDHSLRRKENQKDYQRRILTWFGHYLKGEPAEPWITEGQSYLDREAEVKREKLKKQS